MLKRYLLTPGPTAVPPEVLLRMSQPLIHHRTPEFEAAFCQVQEGLQWLFQTDTRCPHFGRFGDRRNGSSCF